MRASRFTVEQMAHAVAQVEAGVPLHEACREVGISERGVMLAATKESEPP